MNYKELVHEIWEKESFLCIGLDTDMAKIPTHLLKYKNPVLEFNKEIIEATKDLCIAYKPNTAFYEALGADYWISLKGLIQPWLNRGSFINHQISKYGKIRGFVKRAVDK